MAPTKVTSSPLQQDRLERTMERQPTLLDLVLPGATNNKTSFNANEMPKLEDFDNVQLALVKSHAADIKRSRNHAKWIALHGNFLQRARASHALAFPRAAFKTGKALILSSFLNPAALITDPISATYGVIAYGAIFTVLMIASLILYTLDLVGGSKIITKISNQFGQGFCLINWANPDMFNQSRLMTNARKSFVAPPRDIAKISNKSILARKKFQYFDLDVCKSLLLMSSIMYERDDEWVRKAAEFPRWTEILLLKSEEKIHFVTARWGIRFASVSDFTTVAGPYCGIFYSEGPEPWMVVAFKGTSPSNFSEWLVDTTIGHESSGDWLWGDCHQGFFTSLFPASSSGARVVPYERIIETVQLVADDIRQRLTENGNERKIQLFITGHSLGAGLASLFYARCLKAPDDLGDDVELRDGYVFGTPRVGDNDFVTGFEACLNQKKNQHRNLWRVVNQRDFVCSVPPGLADIRERRTNIQQSSLLNYGAIGGEMHLSPRHNEYFYHFNEVGLRAGREPKVIERGGEAPNFPSKKHSWADPIYLMTIFGPFFPFLFDHFTTEYWRSIITCQGAEWDAGDDAKDAKGPSTLPSRIQPLIPPAETQGAGSMGQEPEDGGGEWVG